MQLDNGFTNNSLRSTYAASNIWRGGQAPAAGVGLLTFDGKGKVSGFNLLNLPGMSFGVRRLFRSTFEGSYTVDRDGSGAGTTKITAPDGSTSETSFVFTIAGAEGDKGAKEGFFIVKDLDVTTGALMTFVITRLPEEGDFSLASLKGTFSFNGAAQGSQIPAAGIGLITFDGNGKYSGLDIVNVPGGRFGERQMTRSPFEGTYTMDVGGIYPAINSPSQSEAIFLVTKARTVDGIKVAQEYFYMVPGNVLAVTGGNFVTSVGKKLAE